MTRNVLPILAAALLAAPVRAQLKPDALAEAFDQQKRELSKTPMNAQEKEEARAQVEDLRQLVAGYESKVRALADKTPRTGLQFWDKGSVIQFVRLGSPAEQAGLKSGDRILAVGGVSVEAADSKRVVELIGASDPAVLTIEGRGKVTLAKRDLAPADADVPGLLELSASILREFEPARAGVEAGTISEETFLNAYLIGQIHAMKAHLQVNKLLYSSMPEPAR